MRLLVLYIWAAGHRPASFLANGRSCFFSNVFCERHSVANAWSNTRLSCGNVDIAFCGTKRRKELGVGHTKGGISMCFHADITLTQTHIDQHSRT
jgi:hypothetical protein